MYKNKNKLLGLILGASFLSINFVSAMETSSSQPGINVAGEKAQPDAQQAMVSVGAKLESILTSHPRVEKARGSVCEASFSIAEKRAGFFPNLTSLFLVVTKLSTRQHAATRLAARTRLNMTVKVLI